MSYKDLFGKYKKGELSDKEKEILEEEIEKYEAIEEYLSGDIDDEIFNIKDSNMKDYHKESKSMKKSLNKRLQKVVLTSVIMVVVLYISVFHILSSIVDGFYYNPKSTSESAVEDYVDSNFYNDMKAYISLNIPGYAIGSFTFEESKGFGDYQVSYPMRNLFTREDERYFANISRGNLTYGWDGIFSNNKRFELWSGFEKVQHNFLEEESSDSLEARNQNIERMNEISLLYLEELNPLSYLSTSIVFKEDLNMLELLNIKRQYSGLDFKWVGVRTANEGTSWNEKQPMHLIGFNPNFNDEPSSNRRPDSTKYPLFNLLDIWEYEELNGLGDYEKMAKAYEIHFTSRLKYIKNRKEFIDIFDYNMYKLDFYEDAFSYIEKNGVSTYGVLVYGNPKDILELIEEIEYESIYINQVLPIKPNIYYR